MLPCHFHVCLATRDVFGMELQQRTPLTRMNGNQHLVRRALIVIDKPLDLNLTAAPALSRDYSQFHQHGAPVCLVALPCFVIINHAFRSTNVYSNVIQLPARCVAANVNCCRTLKLILTRIDLSHLYQLML